MSHVLAALLVIPVLAPRAAPAAQSGDAARLVPADATVIVRLESARAWNELVRAFAPLAGPSAASQDLQAVLDGMASHEAMEDPGSLPRLDPEKPLYLAFSFEGGRPSWTFVAPVTNGKPLRIHPTFGATTSLGHGSYAAASTRAGFSVSASENPRLAALRPGVVSVHVDLATLVATFRPLIEMGLSQAEAMVDQVPSDDMSFDMQPLMEAYLGAARGLLERAQALDLDIRHEGEEVALRCAYLEREERGLGGEVADLEPLLGFVDPASGLQLAYNGKWTQYLALFEDLMEAVLEMYPEPLRADIARLLELQRTLDPLLLPGMVVGFDFGTEGVNGAYVMRSPRPAELVAKLEEMLRTLDHPGGMLRVGAAERLLADGLEARVLPLEIQYDALLAALRSMAPGQPSIPPHEAEVLEMMGSLYGRNLRLGLAHRGERVAVCVAGNDSWLRASLARLSTPALPSLKLQRLVAELEPGAVGFAYHVDFGRVMGRMFETLRGVVPGPAFIPSGEVSMDMFGSNRGALWSGGLAMNVAELIRFVSEMRTLGGR